MISQRMSGLNCFSTSRVVTSHPLSRQAFEKLFVPQNSSKTRSFFSFTFIYTYEVFIRRRLRRVLVRTRRVVGLHLYVATSTTIFTRTFVQAIPRTVRATLLQWIYERFRIHSSHFTRVHYIFLNIQSLRKWNLG